jgi:hypothetical protein
MSGCNEWLLTSTGERGLLTSPGVRGCAGKESHLRFGEVLSEMTGLDFIHERTQAGAYAKELLRLGANPFRTKDLLSCLDAEYWLAQKARPLLSTPVARHDASPHSTPVSCATVSALHSRRPAQPGAARPPTLVSTAVPPPLSTPPSPHG